MTYETESEIAKVLQDFESCTTDKGEFRHREHLTVAVCYLQNSTVEVAAEKMRNALLRFLDHHQVDRQKYSETITIFWLESVARELTKLSGWSLVEQCNVVIDSLGDSNSLGVKEPRNRRNP
ncbi:MAG TPA: hypothetical protein VI306_12360 [Pyrinomonadaceae bacterium]